MDEEIRLLRKKHVELFDDEGVADGVMDAVQTALDVFFSNDVVEVSSFYRGGIVGGVSHHAFAVTGPENNVVDETIRLRKAVNLPLRFVVIAEPPNSLVVLDSTAEANDPSVIWCDAQDVERLDSLESMVSPDVWPRYVDFFSYLIGEEENERE